MNHADRFVRLSREIPKDRSIVQIGWEAIGSIEDTDPREIGVGRIDPIEGDVLNAWNGPEVLDVGRRGDVTQRRGRKGLIGREGEVPRGIGASDPVVINGLGLKTGEDFRVAVHQRGIQRGQVAVCRRRSIFHLGGCRLIGSPADRHPVGPEIPRRDLREPRPGCVGGRGGGEGVVAGEGGVVGGVFADDAEVIRRGRIEVVQGPGVPGPEGGIECGESAVGRCRPVLHARGGRLICAPRDHDGGGSQIAGRDAGEDRRRRVGEGRRREEVVPGGGEVACRVSAQNAEMIGRRGGESRQALVMGGSQGHIEACRRAIGCRRSILDLCVAQLVGRPTNGRAAVGQISGGNSREGRRCRIRRGGGGKGVIPGGGQISGGVFAEDAVVIEGGGRESGQPLAVRGGHCTIQRGGRSVGVGGAVLNLGVGRFIGRPANRNAAAAKTPFRDC